MKKEDNESGGDLGREIFRSEYQQTSKSGYVGGRRVGRRQGREESQANVEVPPGDAGRWLGLSGTE